MNYDEILELLKEKREETPYVVTRQTSKGENVKAPPGWSQNAVDIVAGKYFRGNVGDEDRENSVDMLIRRVVFAIGDAGYEADYFQSVREKELFEKVLYELLIGQYFSFNSPVWFNCGVEEFPQCSACFILEVEDTMRSILNWYVEEGEIFKRGSGAGVDLSKVRSRGAPLTGGGHASGPVSFMRAADRSAGTIESGGKTRRAAKMVTLHIDHPDVEEFIDAKVNAEKNARLLIEDGLSSSFDEKGGAYDIVDFQNANHSVRLTSKHLKSVTERNRRVIKKIAEAAWFCGDPGVQYSDTINEWHTCKTDGDIESSNPCSEYVFLNNTSCNLASVNLTKFLDDDEIDWDLLGYVFRIMTIAMDIIVGMAGYPTEDIEEKTLQYRTLGVGFSNLGALFMKKGLPYDSEGARDLAAVISSFMTANVYLESVNLSQRLGPFERFEPNKESMLHVLRKHWDKAPATAVGQTALKGLWLVVATGAEKYGVRNAQATVLAPTGTISFMMDCETTGIEPAFALETHKKLVGGGFVTTKLSCIPDFADLSDPIYQCAMDTEYQKALSPEAHIKMMAACQPHLSGAISKTVNLPNDATVEDILELYMQGAELGLKSLAVYRDGCKASQPLSSDQGSDKERGRNELGSIIGKWPGEETGEEFTDALKAFEAPTRKPVFRRRLPPTRAGVTHKFDIAGQEGYLTVGLYEDGTLGELFVTISKEGSTLSGLVDSWATLVSIGLQHGVPLEAICEKLEGTRFEPSGITQNKDIRFCSSITDYIAKWLRINFLEDKLEEKREEGALKRHSSGDLCSACGGMTIRTGTCLTCVECGTSSGGCS